MSVELKKQTSEKYLYALTILMKFVFNVVHCSYYKLF